MQPVIPDIAVRSPGCQERTRSIDFPGTASWPRSPLESVQMKGTRIDMDRFHHSIKPWEVYR